MDHTRFYDKTQYYPMFASAKIPYLKENLIPAALQTKTRLFMSNDNLLMEFH